MHARPNLVLIPMDARSAAHIDALAQQIESVLRAIPHETPLSKDQRLTWALLHEWQDNPYRRGTGGLDGMMKAA